MVTALVPIAVFAGVTATVFFAFFSFWNALNERANARVRGLSEQLDRAGIRLSSQEIVLTASGGAMIVWISVILILHTSPLLSILLLLGIVAFVVLGFSGFVQFCIARRRDAFINQLEPSMRLIAGGLRVGLGLRQALAIVIDELSDPARYEFRRVIGQTNIGVSIYDAIDDLAARMPSHESMMIARVFRVQSETGGDLARILDQLADTIKARRQVQRKTASLTAEGRMSAWVLMAIPVGLGVFIAATQPHMAYALFYTWIGHFVLAIVFGLEALAFITLKGIMKMDV
jgi:tight adherence protein B